MNIHRFLNKSTAKWCKRFPPHLNNVSILPCATWNTRRTCATIELLQTETPAFITPQLWPQMRQTWINCLQYTWTIATEGVLNMHHWSERTETVNENGVGIAISVMSSWRQPFVSGIVDSSRSVMRVLYTFYCNISHILLSTGFNSGEFGGHSWGGINSGVSRCNSMIARVRWAFRLSQSSVEISFRWRRKRLHHFAANLFRKRSTVSHQNRSSFIGDVTKHFGLFFWTQCIRRFSFSQATIQRLASCFSDSLFWFSDLMQKLLHDGFVQE